MYDFLIVGAGFSGSVLAEQLANSGKKILLIDKRNHIGGNAYDFYNEAGILVHLYGPHIFHTNSAEVFDYLSEFTKWRKYEHEVLASVDGKLVPIPINQNTVNQLYNLNLTEDEVAAFLASKAEPLTQIRTSEDVVVSKVGRELYEKFFRGYTRKQWALDPSQLDASVTARVPTRTNNDNRYFTDEYQAMPLEGYTKMFERMLNHQNITILTGVDFKEVAKDRLFSRLIFTGPVDEYFDYCFGKLPYRSLDFRFETLKQDTFQQTGTINYPNDKKYTRISEFKYITGQQHPFTTVVYEYPKAEGDPYYPIPRPENAALYNRYKKLADALPNVWFAGRLGTYKYYNMDQVVAQALVIAKKILKEETPVGKETSLSSTTNRHVTAA